MPHRCCHTFYLHVSRATRVDNEYHLERALRPDYFCLPNAGVDYSTCTRCVTFHHRCMVVDILSRCRRMVALEVTPCVHCCESSAVREVDCDNKWIQWPAWQMELHDENESRSVTDICRYSAICVEKYNVINLCEMAGSGSGIGEFIAVCLRLSLSWMKWMSLSPSLVLMLNFLPTSPLRVCCKPSTSLVCIVSVIYITIIAQTMSVHRNRMLSCNL